MYRIRFHGRGGQGIKTASRVLGSAFSRQGYEVQDAPRYGAERRGAPIFAYVRASMKPVFERGVIQEPDLVVVTDESLIGLPAAGVLQGIDPHTGLLIATATAAKHWSARLSLESPIQVLAAGAPGKETSLTMAGAAARWAGVISKETLMLAVHDELASLGELVLEAGYRVAAAGYDQLSPRTALMPRANRSTLQHCPPEWIDLEAACGRSATPTIFGSATSLSVHTGLWRTVRPVIDRERCRGCWWVCSNFCPDAAIRVREASPSIELDYCKGCAICVVQCPHHAIDLIAEDGADEREARQ